MAYRGQIRDGVVVFHDGVKLPDGTEVHIEPVPHDETSPAQRPTLAEQFADIIGTVPELPADMADQHDHYLHGAPKR